MSSIKRLHDLQQLDWQLSASCRSLNEVRANLENDSALLEAKKSLAEIESPLADLITIRKKAELSTQQLEEKIKEVEAQLYGGTITNLRELSGYELERSMLQGRHNTEEEKLLELMVQAEDLQSARNKSQQNLDHIEAARIVERAELQKEEEYLTSELERLNQLRSEITPQIPISALSIYDSIRKIRNGHAVAKVERGMCQGCRLVLPTMELQHARNSKGIVQCSSCQRILTVE